jgi:hypothetical protein
MGSRWERLLEQKPVPVVQALLDEVAKRVAGELTRWPLPVEGVDMLTVGAAEAQLRADTPRPPDEVFIEAFKLAKWDLARETDALDEYLRNRRYLERDVAQEARPALLFITRWLVEQMLSLSEATEGRVKRKELTACLERIAHRFQTGAKGASA